MLLCVRAACGDTTRGNCVLAASASRSQTFSSLALLRTLFRWSSEFLIIDEIGISVFCIWQSFPRACVL